LRSDRTALVGLILLALFVTMALTAPLFAERTELQAAAGRNNPDLAAPSGKFWLGTDDIGRDVFALVMWGARVSLYIGLLATVVAVVIGSVLGLIAGYSRGWISRLMLAIDDFFLVLPFIPLAIVLALLLGRSPTVLALVIGGTFWAGGSRLIRAQVLSLRERGYVERATALGASNRHIIVCRPVCASSVWCWRSP
jgi:peptide/nickel transport system permease protein